MKLVKCEIVKGSGVYFECPNCKAQLEDVPETSKGADPAVFLCPQCHRFFNNSGIIPFEVADEMFPDASEYLY